MRFKRIFQFFAACFFIGLIHPSPAFAVKTRYLTIGTGAVTGHFFPVGGALAQLLNKHRDTYALRVSVEATAGSEFNIKAVLAQDLEIALVQGDKLHEAVQSGQKELRALFQLYPEIVTLVFGDDHRIDQLKDLKGKKVNLGQSRTGQRVHAINVLNASGLEWRKDIKHEYHRTNETPELLQDNEIDGFFFTAGHPNDLIPQAALGKRRIRIVPLSGLEEVLKKNPFYQTAKIPAETYPFLKIKENIESIGIYTTVIASSRLSDEIAYEITRRVFENLNELRRLHPVLATLNKNEMTRGLQAPLHAGAERFLREAGLLPKAQAAP